MSDYIHKKAIRLPITKSLIRKVQFSNTEDFIEQDIEDFIENFDQRVNEKCPELHHCSDRTPYFEVEVTDERSYIDLVLYYSYGKEYDDWEKASYLSDKEKEFFVPYFDKLGIVFEPENLRKVDYCWYNCCEPPDCYDVDNDDDDWTKLIGIYGY